MSAWLVMSALGLYPVCPGCGGLSEYTIGAPLFDNIVMRMPTMQDSISGISAEVMASISQTQDQGEEQGQEQRKEQGQLRQQRTYAHAQPPVGRDESSSFTPVVVDTAASITRLNFPDRDPLVAPAAALTAQVDDSERPGGSNVPDKKMKDADQDLHGFETLTIQVVGRIDAVVDIYVQQLFINGTFVSILVSSAGKFSVMFMHIMVRVTIILLSLSLRR